MVIIKIFGRFWTGEAEESCGSGNKSRVNKKREKRDDLKKRFNRIGFF